MVRRVQEKMFIGKALKIFVLLSLLSLLMTVSCTMYRDMQTLKKPRYEVSEHKGAKSCGECHQEIYDQWSNNSRHAIATKGDLFNEMKKEVEDDFMLNMMMGGEMCYSCHGSKEVNEGVNCETCHGTANTSLTTEEIHRTKFKPGLEDLKRADFCGKCHEMKHPMSGAALLSLYSEWKESPVAKEGKGCQDCHMKPDKKGLSYHGFDSAKRNVEIYRDDLKIKDVKLNFPRLTLAIENRVAGHAVPASGPTRIMALNIDFFDHQGKKTHTITETFSKSVTLMRKIMPNKIVKNTQLQAGETRKLSFTLPHFLQGNMQKLVISMRFYEVPDKYLGDLKKATWVSDSFLEIHLNGLEEGIL